MEEVLSYTVLKDVTAADIKIIAPKVKPGVTNNKSQYGDGYFIKIKNFSGRFSFENVIVTSKIDDPKDRKYKESDKINISTTSDKCGDLGKILLNLEEQLMIAIKRSISDLTIDARESHIISTFVKRKYSDKGAKKGEEYENPWITFTYDSTYYPEKYYNPLCAGKPKSSILDFNQRKEVKVNGKTLKQYEPAKIDGELVDKTNLHKYIVPNSIIKKGRFIINNLFVGATYISVHLLLSMATIDKPNLIGYSDEFIDEGSSDNESVNIDNDLSAVSINENINSLID